MKILVTGSQGQLANELKIISLKNNDYDFSFLSKDELDITDFNKLEKIISKNNFHAIINCAAMTNVDACEQRQEDCWNINVKAVEYIASASESIKAHLVHLSTDFIFDGKSGPYSEEDTPNPLHFYAKSKLESERIVTRN